MDEVGAKTSSVVGSVRKSMTVMWQRTWREHEGREEAEMKWRKVEEWSFGAKIQILDDLDMDIQRVKSVAKVRGPRFVYDCIRHKWTKGATSRLYSKADQKH